jgi:4-amino-4-deoxy-L-arabinose transferase-like glycosyltransferase
MGQARVRKLGGWVSDFLLLALFSVPLLFLDLGSLPLVLWDESRLANNAIEMSRNGFNLMTTYLERPDLWNTKPPLLIWLITGSFRIFGISEWALRLPSALAAMATSAMVYGFCRRVTTSRAAGIGGALVLLTTFGFIGPHVARTGDYDALLIYFTTATAFIWYCVLEDLRSGTKVSNRLLVCFSLALCGAIMTKGVAGLLILPGLALASLSGRAVLKIVSDWRYWLAAAAPLVITCVYYVAREATGPGYLHAVWINELGGRFMTPLEGHGATPIFYFSGLLWPWGVEERDFCLASAAPWSWIALLLLPFGARDARATPAIGYLAIVLVAFLIVLSAAKTRISWYVGPVYPLMACLVAIGAFAALQQIWPAGSDLDRRRAAIMLGSFAIMSGITGLRILERNRAVIAHAAELPELRSAAFLHDLVPKLHPGTSLWIIRDARPPSLPENPASTEYSPQEEFYAAILRSRGIVARITSPNDQFERGDTVAWCDPSLWDKKRVGEIQIAGNNACHLARIVNARPYQ